MLKGGVWWYSDVRYSLAPLLANVKRNLHFFVGICQIPESRSCLDALNIG